ncbi:MAG: aromatic amino acid ammonia-lyase [Myxococcota bacterium]
MPKTLRESQASAPQNLPHPDAHHRGAPQGHADLSQVQTTEHRPPLELGPEGHLSAEAIAEASRRSTPNARLTLAAERAMRESHRALNVLVEQGREIYGLTTGYGPFVSFRADADPQRQGLGLINHLASGWGPEAPAPIVRAAMLLRAQTVAQGRSGIQPAVARTFVALINAGIVPAVPEVGSVGASGDLIPMAHVVQCLAGRGEAITEEGDLIPGARALADANLEPPVLGARDALALVNGTAFMTAYALHALVAAERLMQRAEQLTAWIVRLLQARTESLDPRLHAARGHQGQATSAAHIRSAIAHQGEHQVDMGRPLQEVYSIRCAPQWLGAGREQLAYARRLIEAEINGVSDNPILCTTTDGHPDVLHGGNFQGTQIAFAADAINTALTHTALLAERQLDVLSNPELNGGAPLLLAHEPGPDAGIAGIQITATAIVADMRLHAQPGAIASMPTNGRNQDVVSMGTLAARNAWQQVDRCAGVLAACSMGASQLNHLRHTGRAPGPSTSAPAWMAHHHPFDADQPTRHDLQRLAAALLAHEPQTP